MPVRLTRGEFWLLGAAVDMRLPLELLLLPDGPPWDRPTLNEALNMPGHGLDAVALKRTLRRLLRLGWMDLVHDNPLPATEEAAFKHWYGPSYGLTAEGGAVWEDFARPDWSRYIEHGWSDDQPVAADVLDAFRQQHDRDDDIRGESWLSEIAVHEIVAATLTELQDYLRALRGDHELGEPGAVELLAPWRVTYWKSLPAGYRVRVPARSRLLCSGTASHVIRAHWCQWQ